MIPRGALLQAMEALGFGPADQQRIVDAVEGVLVEEGSNSAFGGGCVRHGEDQWIEGFCVQCENDNAPPLDGAA